MIGATPGPEFALARACLLSCKCRGDSVAYAATGHTFPGGFFLHPCPRKCLTEPALCASSNKTRTHEKTLPCQALAPSQHLPPGLCPRGPGDRPVGPLLHRPAGRPRARSGRRRRAKAGRRPRHGAAHVWPHLNPWPCPRVCACSAHGRRGGKQGSLQKTEKIVR